MEWPVSALQVQQCATKLSVVVVAGKCIVAALAQGVAYVHLQASPQTSPRIK